MKAELKKVYEQLTPIERYALHLIEASSQAVNDMELQEAEVLVCNDLIVSPFEFRAFKQSRRLLLLFGFSTWR